MSPSPEQFRHRLLELAAEYESLHASGADRAAVHGRKQLSLVDSASVAESSASLQPMSPQMSAVEPAVAPALSAESMFGRMCTPAFYASAPSSASNSPRRLAVRSSPSSGGEGEGVPTVGGSFSMRSSQGSGQRAPPAGKGAPAGARARAGTPGRSVAGQMLARARRPRLAGRSGSLDGGPARLGSSDGARARIPHQCPTLTEQRRFKAAVRRTEVNMRVNLPMPEDDAFLIRVVRSRGFSIGIAVLILFSTVMIGVETQLLSSLSSQEESSSEQLVSALSVTNYALTLLFTAELVVRLYAFRFDFFVHERVWNFFDVIILVLALAEVALEIVVKAVSGTRGDMFGAAGGSAKVLRLFRLTRLLRLVRTIRQLKPLRLLLHSLFCAGKSVFWALLLLFIIVYSFGVILTQAVTEHTESGTRVEDELLMDYYGNLYRSMLSLWWAVSGGISWNELTEPLERTGSSLWVALFLVYIAFVYFFILNVVTGVFCQNAIEGAQQDLELTIESQLREKQVYADRLRLLFEEMNECSTDRSEGLTAAEINFQLAKPKVQSWFKALDIDAQQAWKLFKILDAEKSGRVSLEDFVEGCLKLRGPATRVDVESLKWDVRGAYNRGEATVAMLAELSHHLAPHAIIRETFNTASDATGRSSIGESEFADNRCPVLPVDSADCGLR